jgi:adenosylmethionine-8-amino-7-oxononanoate aminotransferase
MVGIDLGEHDPALRMGHRVTLEARERGVLIRPLGDTVILMPPLSISKAELYRLVSVTSDSIEAAAAVLEADVRGRADAALLDSPLTEAA